MKFLKSPPKDTRYTVRFVQADLELAKALGIDLPKLFNAALADALHGLKASADTKKVVKRS